MIKEAIDRLEALVRERDRVEFKQAPGEPKDAYYLCQSGQPTRLVRAEAGPRHIYCESVIGACEAIRELVVEEADATRFVYVGPQGVRAHLHEFGDRRDTVRMPLTLTPQMAAIVALTEKPIDQPELVWLLRSTLSQCCTHPQFPTMVRKLKFKSNSEGDRSVGIGRESIGASVVKEMAGIDGELPEEVGFIVPVYEEIWHDTQAGKRHEEEIILAVNVDLQKQQFVFRPIGSATKDALRNARRAAVTQFREKLGERATVIEEATVE